jgi:small subunit ribosomal protein S18
MARNNDRDRTSRRAPRDTGRRTKKKICIFCKDHNDSVDYKDVNLLRKFMSDRGKIRARRVSGNCAQHQRDVAMAIKTARELALLPYTQRTTSERPGGRGMGRGGPGGGRGGPRDGAGGDAPRGEGRGPEVAVEAGPAEAEADAEVLDETEVEAVETGTDDDEDGE